MASKIFDVKVVAVDRNTGFAKLVDSDEIDDVVTYDMFIAGYFGGQHNPYPRPGESLRIRYGRMSHGHGIMECWRTTEERQSAA